MKKALFLIPLIAFCNCSHSSQTEIYQNKRNNIVDVQDQVKEIEIDEVLIHAAPSLHTMDKYLMIKDHESHDKLIHLFNKDDFSYITSFGDKGEGPGEIINIGHIGINEADRQFYVTDHSKLHILSYDLDSVLLNPSYLPKVKMKLNKGLFPDRYKYFNDTLCMGLVIKPTSDHSFEQFVGKWNLETGDISLMEYKHPEVKKKRVSFAASSEHNLYVECYAYHDLISILTLDGKLKYNIYGCAWNNRTSNKIHYYDNIFFCKDKIVVAYSGGENLTDAYHPTKFLVFDINGNYIRTLETGYQIFRFCYDEDNNRIIMTLNNEMQFAYLDLDGLI